MTNLQDLRHSLLELHRALVDAERREFERAHGRITPGEFLNHLISDDAYAWLRPFTVWLVRLDELLDSSERPHDDDPISLLGELRALLDPNASDSAFQRRYGELVQLSPEVAFAHGASLHSIL